MPGEKGVRAIKDRITRWAVLVAAHRKVKKPAPSPTAFVATWRHITLADFFSSQDMGGPCSSTVLVSRAGHHVVGLCVIGFGVHEKVLQAPL